eukprot:jgi/Chlat1/3245/Chrsp22S03512
MGNCMGNSAGGKKKGGGGAGGGGAGGYTNADKHGYVPPHPHASPPPVYEPKPREDMNMAHSHGRANAANTVLGRVTEDVHKLYILGRELGRGQFGVTHLAVERSTNLQYACKSISKRKLVSKEDIEDVRREIAIMHHLSGHPNIVEIKGSYEDKNSVHLVMELCAGGELFDRIIERGHYTEKAAAAVIRTILHVVKKCHDLGVIHRDLKPENFLLATKAEDAPLKATDFGLSVFFKPGDILTDIVGSAYYVAPEVLKRHYSCEADIWSCGVILYILLCGVPPFWAETEQGIFDAVLKGHIDFKSEPWPKISDGAKDCVLRMLKMDLKQRVTATEALNHPWVREDGEAPDQVIDNTVLRRLQNFSVMNRLKKAALKIIAQNLSEEEISGLKKLFALMDADNNGTITFEELKAGLAKLGAQLAESEVRALMNAADVDGNGTIDYEEFIAATMQMNKLEKEENMWAAFGHFDTDHSGFITADELRAVLVQNNVGDLDSITEIIDEIDQDKDGKINYEEFVGMMRAGTEMQRGSLRDRSLHKVLGLP